jgi:hypothetical protein
VRLQEAIRAELGIEAQLAMAAPGVLDVRVDGQKVFSKREAGHMPTPEEIVGLLKGR